ncbi:MAG: conjugal transfer protein TraG N-terminal domain-containing protein [Rickettsiales bacterium]|nr:conjugal transfer protein TraG N-terminal domain-containing protein [Rickettsiales bacterium]
MDLYTFDIYTVGAGWLLEKALNAVRLILADGSYLTALKIIALGAITSVIIKNSRGDTFKEAFKYIATIMIIFPILTMSTARVRIHDKMRDAYGGLPVIRVVDEVPLGLAFLGSLISSFGYAISLPFEMVFSAVFSNPTYGKTGMLFGSRIVEDASNITLLNSQVLTQIRKFYRGCIVPDVHIAYARKNGYTMRDLINSEDILGFLRERSSKVRRVYFRGKIKQVQNSNPLDIFTTPVRSLEIDDYVTCKQAAEYLSDMIEYEVRQNMPSYASSFLSIFYPNSANSEKQRIFESVLSDSYGLFIKSSKGAKDILVQNVVINSLKHSISIGSSYSQVLAEKYTKASSKNMFYMAQKWIPLLLGFFEVFLYAIYVILIGLAFLPGGLQYLRNYGEGFVWLQLWQPVYIIIYCIAGVGGAEFSQVNSLTFATHRKIASISDEIGAIAGFMLAFVPFLAVIIRSGVGGKMVGMATSMLHNFQNAAMSASTSAVTGNYNVGNTQMDNHSYNNTSANKYNDNHDFRSGAASWNTGTGTDVTQFANKSLISKHHTNQLGGLIEGQIIKSLGNHFNVSKAKAQHEKEVAGVRYANNTYAALSKLFGYDQGVSLNSHSGKNWRDSLGGSERDAYTNVEGAADALSKKWGISKDVATKYVFSASVGIGVPKGLPLGVSGELNAGSDSTRQETEQNIYDDALNLAKDKRLSRSFDILSSFVRSKSFGIQKGLNQNVVDSIKDDFNKSYQAGNDYSKAIENVNNIQEQESFFKSHQRDIRASLNHHFGKWGHKKYGAAQFGEILKADPRGGLDLINQYIQEEVIDKGLLDQIKELKYEPKNLEEVQNQFEQDFEEYSNKANNFTKQTAEEAYYDEDSPLQAAQASLFNAKNLKEAVKRRLQIDGRKQIEDYDDNIGKTKRLIRTERNKQEDIWDDLQDNINDRKGNPTKDKAWRNAKKLMIRGLENFNEIVRKLSGDSITKSRREKDIYYAFEEFKEEVPGENLPWKTRAKIWNKRWTNVKTKWSNIANQASMEWNNRNQTINRAKITVTKNWSNIKTKWADITTADTTVDRKSADTKEKALTKDFTNKKLQNTSNDVNNIKQRPKDSTNK